MPPLSRPAFVLSEPPARLRLSDGDYDLVLVTANAEDGLRVAYDHLPDNDEFELVLWGRFRQ